MLLVFEIVDNATNVIVFCLFLFFRKCEDVTLCPHYYQDVLAYVCGGSALLGLLVLFTLVPFNRCLFTRGKLFGAFSLFSASTVKL